MQRAKLILIAAPNSFGSDSERRWRWLFSSIETVYLGMYTVIVQMHTYAFTHTHTEKHIFS